MKEKNNDLKKLRDIVKEAVLTEMGEMPKEKSMHDTVVDIAKAAATGMKALSSLKNKAMPTQKATQAVSSSIRALEMIFQDMSTNPTKYLDTGDPAQVVQKHLRTLDDRESALRDNQAVSGDQIES